MCTATGSRIIGHFFSLVLSSRALWLYLAWGEQQQQEKEQKQQELQGWRGSEQNSVWRLHQMKERLLRIGYEC